MRLEPLEWVAHEQGFFAVVGGKENARLWDHVSVGPYVDPTTFREIFEKPVRQMAGKPWSFVM
ncbi:MAG: hypothetical protein P8L66_07640 [Rhodospirillaceae bacterium]|nr:hypothetical protein [Rhodospirillaceae bacterium]